MKEYVAIKNKTFRAIQLTKEITLHYLGFPEMQTERDGYGDVAYVPGRYLVFLGNGETMLMEAYEFALIFEEKGNPDCSAKGE